MPLLLHNGAFLRWPHPFSGPISVTQIKSRTSIHLHHLHLPALGFIQSFLPLPMCAFSRNLMGCQPQAVAYELVDGHPECAGQLLTSSNFPKSKTTTKQGPSATVVGWLRPGIPFIMKFITFMNNIKQPNFQHVPTSEQSLPIGPGKKWHPYIAHTFHSLLVHKCIHTHSTCLKKNKLISGYMSLQDPNR